MRMRESREQVPPEQDSVDRVALLLDADLEPEERRRLLADVAADSGLRRHYREIGAAWELLDAFPAIEVSPHAGEGALDQVRAELARERRGRLVRLTLGWVAAAGIFLAVFLGLPGERPGAGSLAQGGLEVEYDESDEGGYARAFDYDFDLKDY